MNDDSIIAAMTRRIISLSSENRRLAARNKELREKLAEKRVADFNQRGKEAFGEWWQGEQEKGRPKPPQSV